MDPHTIKETGNALAAFVFGTLFLSALAAFVILAVTANPGDVKEMEADNV